MNFATVILVYVIAWWMVFFMMLPVGVRSQHESEDGITAGTEPGAPVKPMLKKKMIITSIIAVFLTIGYYFLQDSGLYSFRTPRS